MSIGDSAVGQMLGYLYQIDRAILALSQTNDDGVVEVETDDDIVVRLKKGTGIDAIYEQDKSSLKRANPFSDSSVNLWKSLAIWVNLINDKKLKISSSKFFLISSRKLPPSCLAATISKAQTDAEAKSCLKKLRDTALNLKGKASSFSKVVMKEDDSFLVDLIKVTSAMGGDYHQDKTEYKKLLRSNLKIPDDVVVDEVLWYLSGWVTDTLISKWLKDEPGAIPVKSFNQIFFGYITRFGSKPFIEKTLASLPITNSERQKERNSRFVKQLEHINLPDRSLLNCIDDFIRSQAQKKRYAQTGKMPPDAFPDFNENLIKYWEQTFDLVYDSDPIAQGRQIFQKCMESKFKLAGVEPEQPYTIKGEYHYLANESKLGWHPDWEKLMI